MTRTRADETRSRASSTNSSLMQDVPGAFPTIPSSDTYEDEDLVGEEERPAPLNLFQAVHARRSEYVRPKEVRIKVGSWNVAAVKGAEKDVGAWFVGGKGVSERLAGLEVSEQDREEVSEQEARYARKSETLPKDDVQILPGDSDIGLYVLGLQEVVDISSATEALRPFTDATVATKWKSAMQGALPSGYQLVAEQQLIGLLVLIYASPDIAKDVKAISTTSVGTGLMGVMGNKGAVTARIVLGETTRLMFINSHLAAGADKTSLERRNWDVQQIVGRTQFEPIKDAMDLSQTTGEKIGDEDFAFWFGDLNYRLEGIPGEDVRRLLMLHTRQEYDVSQPSARMIEREVQNATDAVENRLSCETATMSPVSATFSSHSSTGTRQSTESTRPSTILDEVADSLDPTSLQTTLSSLLPHDELRQQMDARKAFYDGWREGPIAFLPTYKYDPGTVGVFDSSEKKRAPSWCDRILYRTRRDKLAYDTKVREEESVRKKDEEMQANGLAENNDEAILYDYDPDIDGAEEYDDTYEEANDGVVMTKEGFEDEIELEYYTAHQRVLSSDHKPLDAIFRLKYNAVVPELKAKIHTEVARELDRAENECRPNVTVVVDAHHSKQETSDACAPEKFEGVWFGDVRWAQSKHRSLTLANTSRVDAKFSFIERPTGEATKQQPGIAPDWLNLRLNNEAIPSSIKASSSVTLEPGETCMIGLELRIFSLEDVKDLNSNRAVLEDILVLRIENGRDHFIPVRANWLESSLGSSINKLIRIPEGGIRKLQRQRPGTSGKRSAKGADPDASAASIVMVDKETEDEQQPVRFSAPRELFRLTEAIEELSTRVVAEWEMTNPTSPTGASRESFESASSISTTSAGAPWDSFLAWPFAEECWAERKSRNWELALSEACDALDDDKSLLESPILSPEGLPRLQRLYVLCCLLLLFLRNMPDGIISADIWPGIETYLLDLEKKPKQRPSREDQRTAIQEIVSHKPSHSISFVLLTSMLERMLQDISGNARDQSEPGSRTSSSSRVGSPLRRIARLGRMPPGPRKEQASVAFAKIFADAIVHAAPPVVKGEKAKQALEKRKVELVELFLKKDEVGG